MRPIRLLLFLAIAAVIAAGIPALFPSLLWQMPKSVPDPATADPGRGAYLFAMSGCAGCHTRKGGTPLAGGREIPSPFGVFVSPNITPHKENGIGSWSPDEIVFALQTGVTPSGDVMGGEMEEVVTNVTSKLTDADRRAIVEYLRGVPAKALE